MPEEKQWHCLVCGYVHDGGSPPESCPICGSAGGEFEAYAQSVPLARPPPGRWQCMNCGYVHDGGSPPAECPVCGVAREAFGPLRPEGAAPAAAAAAGRMSP